MAKATPDCATAIPRQQLGSLQTASWSDAIKKGSTSLRVNTGQRAPSPLATPVEARPSLAFPA